MLVGDRRERAAGAADHEPTVLARDGRHRTELRVQEFVRGLHTRVERRDRVRPNGEFTRQALSGVPHHLLHLLGPRALRQHAQQMRQQRNVRARQELFDFRRELEHERRPRRAAFVTRAADESVALHHQQLRPDGIRRQPELRGHLFRSQSAPLKKRGNSAAARLEKLLPQHVVTLSVPASCEGLTMFLESRCVEPDVRPSRTTTSG